MLQDLASGRLENEFYCMTPSPEDTVICVRGNTILIHSDDQGRIALPAYVQVQAWAEEGNWERWREEAVRYVFCMQGMRYFLWMGEAGDCGDPNYHYENFRQFRRPEARELCFVVMTAWHLFVWYRNNRYCGRCAAPTIHDDQERMLRCPECGNLIFPRISPAVIVAVTDGDRLLMSKYAGRSYAHYALIAGYTEIGETLEQTVHREVMEEVGLRVKNIRYYKSQPWGVDGNILMGFYCDLDGDETIHLDRNELALAEWHHRDALPAKDDGISLTREMIRVFGEGREPKS